MEDGWKAGLKMLYSQLIGSDYEDHSWTKLFHKVPGIECRRTAWCLQNPEVVTQSGQLQGEVPMYALRLTALCSSHPASESSKTP